MGDRCYLALYLHGPIKDMRSLSKIVTAILAEHFDDETGRTNANDKAKDSVLANLADAWAQENLAEFTMQECNCANIDDVEEVLTAVGCSWSVNHGEGGEYSGGARSWSPDRGRLEAVDAHGDTVLTVREIRAVMDDREALELLVRQTEQAGGFDLPRALKVDDKVGRYLARFVALQALKVA